MTKSERAFVRQYAAACAKFGGASVAVAAAGAAQTRTARCSLWELRNLNNLPSGLPFAGRPFDEA